MVFSLCAAALVLNGLSVFILATDYARQAKKRLPGNTGNAEIAGDTEDAEDAVDAVDAEITGTLPSNPWLTKKFVIFGSLMTLLSIGIAVSMSQLNASQSFLFDLKRLCLLSLLWPVAFVDFQTYRIPNLFIVTGLAYRVIILMCELIVEPEGLWLRAGAELIAAVALALAAFLCGLLIKNSIGFGDIKLFIVMGLLLGLDGIWGSVFVSLIVSFVISAVFLITRKKKRKDVIPFAPALMIGTYISVFLTGM
ncbi:MAG: A24 family peptidase [Oscillospiraceae bacterium]|nr:A24 family peptidase [Oscillospiraceae bacterium]